jgi:hypothetical protein
VHIAYSLVLMASDPNRAHSRTMGTSVIRSARAIQEASPDLETSICAVCTQPIHRVRSTWEHEGTGASARLPVRHHATPA